jgi:hypothetical protein
VGDVSGVSFVGALYGGGYGAEETGLETSGCRNRHDRLKI